MAADLPYATVMIYCDRKGDFVGNGTEEKGVNLTLRQGMERGKIGESRADLPRTERAASYFSSVKRSFIRGKVQLA